MAEKKNSPQKTEKTGGVLKLRDDIHGWDQSYLRECNFIENAYFIKFDGRSVEDGKKEQIQLFINSHDAAALVTALTKFLRENHPREFELYKELHGLKETDAP